MKELPIRDFLPLEGQEAFVQGDDLKGIRTLVSLGEGTCTQRAALTYCALQKEAGRTMPIHCVNTFDQARTRIRNDLHAMMLVPQLHQIQRELEEDPQYQNMTSQAFQLHNPSLYIATPTRTTSSRTYLWSLPTLVPLVQEVYGGQDLPFEEIVPAKSTQDAAIQCSTVFGGAFCVTNEEGLRKFELRPVQQLRHILMKWFFYRKISAKSLE